MATSGSTDFALNRDQIIKSALAKIGGYDRVGTPSLEAWQVTQGGEALNLVVKSLQDHGVYLWTVEEVHETIVSGSSYFEPGASYTDTINIEKIYYRDSSTDIDIELVDKFNFLSISDKSTTGKPLKAWVERNLTKVKVHLWPVLDADTVIYYTRIRKLQDFDAATNDADFPVRWMEYLIYQTAYRLAPEYYIPVQERLALKADADEALKLAKKGNYEATDNSFVDSAY